MRQQLAIIGGLAAVAACMAEGPEQSTSSAALVSQTLTFSALDDARVESASPTTNYGTSDFLRTHDTGTNVVQSYLKFQVTGTTAAVQSARLRLYITDGTDDASPVYAVSNTTWSESTITWATRPTIGTAAGVDPIKIPSVGYVEWDVTALVTGDGTYAFALVPQSPTADVMNARSRNDAVYPHPELVVITAPTKTTFAAAADARVNADYPGSNYGTSYLWVRPPTSEYPEVHSYLRFNVSGITGTITNARVRLFNYEWASDGPSIHVVNGSTWAESTLTWNNKPAASTELDDKGPVPNGMYYEWDVTDAVTGNGTYDFALLPDPTSHSMRAYSKEHGVSAERPELVVLSEPAGGGSEVVKWPISASTSADGDLIRDPYGPRLLSSGYDFHAGIDLSASCGTNVHAVLAGTVVDVETAWSGTGPGKHVIIEHAPAQTGQPKRYTSYLHMSSISVGELDVVSAGTVLGQSGDTGASYCHLHLTYMLGVTPDGSGEWSNQESKSHNPLELLPHTAMGTPSATIGASSAIQLPAQRMTVRKVTIANASNSRTADYYTIVSVPSTRDDQTQAGIKFTAGDPTPAAGGVFTLTLEADPASFVPDRVILEDIFGATYTLTNGGIAPGAPTNLAAEPVSSTAVDLAWDPPTGLVDGYKVYRGTSEIANLTAPTTSYRDTGRAANTSYTYKVVAYHGTANSGDSAPATAVTHKADANSSGTGFTYGSLTKPVTIHSIGLKALITGDTNYATIGSAASGTVRYREVGAARWSRAHDLFRISYRGVNALSGSIMFLDPGTTYELLLYLQDPNGGVKTVTTTATTRDVPALPVGGRTFYVVPGSGGGTGTSTNPFQGLAAAQAVALPGDTFRLRTGSYGTFTFSVSGNASSGHIVWMRDGASAVPTFSQVWTNASWIWLEGLRFRDPPASSDTRFIRQSAMADDVVIVRCDFLGADHAIYLRQDLAGSTDRWYIADNVIVGTKTLTGDPEPMNGEGIDLDDGVGNVVAHNKISLVADAISHPGGDSDIFGNDIFDITDDAIEADDATENLRIWRNRLANTHNGFSFQHMWGAPWYVVRNQFINGEQDPLKLRTDTVDPTKTVDRFLLAHNTFVQWAVGTPDAVQSIHGYHMLRAHVKNNLWVALGGARMWDLSDATQLIDWRTAIDHNGFDLGATSVTKAFEYGPTASYDTLSAFRTGTGLEASGVTFSKSTCFATFNVPSAPPASVPVQTLTLSSGCAAVDAGAVLPNLSDGYTGTAPDLGAYERNTTTPTFGPRP